MKLVFMGTPGFAVPALRALVDAKHEIVAVYTQPPRPAGRGQRETPAPVQVEAERLGIPVHTPVTLKNEAEQGVFITHCADAAVVAAYGLLLPKPILNAFPLGCINIHPSLLPRWRGAAPLQRTLMAGDVETGVTIMQMDEGLDTGDMLTVDRFLIPPDMNMQGLHDALSLRGADLLIKTLHVLAHGKLNPVPQPAEGVTYAKKITKEECRIDWKEDAADIHNKIRALAPRPGASFEYRGEVIKALASELLPTSASAPPGTVLDDVLTIACGRGALNLRVLQRPGKQAMSAEETLRGFPILMHTMLG
jgi:methionyl-tRNA formyltransferase